MIADLDEPLVREAKSRPLFQEPSPEIERTDPWSGPKGFMLGGMVQSNDASLAEEYYHAAEAIIDAIRHDEIEDYKVANAALFLYRHSCELILKAALPPDVRAAKRTHNLASLADSFAYWVKEREGRVVPAWVLRRLKELAAIDPGSEAFRYGNYLDPLTSDPKGLSGEVYVDLGHLRRAMTALNTALVSFAWEIRMARGERP